MMAFFPMWVLILMRFFQRHCRTAGRMNYSQRRKFIQEMIHQMAVPQGRLETWLMARLMTWLDRERNAMETLERLQVSVVLVQVDHKSMISPERLN
jgi:hypothetical protein